MRPIAQFAKNSTSALVTIGSSLLVTCSAISSSFAAPVVWPQSAGGNGHAYEIVTLTRYWVDARAEAESRSFGGKTGYLATITSPAEQNFIISALLDPNAAWDSAPQYWLGATDATALYAPASEGNFKWITGEPFVFGAPTGSPPYDSYTDFPHPPWHIDNPSNSPKSWGPENCLTIFTGFGGIGLPETPHWTWNDAENREAALPFIVEYPTPEPQAIVMMVMGAGLVIPFAKKFRRRKIRGLN